MRLTRIGWLAVAALLFCAALLSIAYRHRKTNERVLPDGSVLRLEKIYYGKPEPYDYDGWLGGLKKRLPQKLINYFSKPTKLKSGLGKSSWYTIAPINTNNDALYVYVTRRDRLTGKLQNVGFRMAWLEDEHGCILPCTQAGGEDDGRLSSGTSPMGGSSVNWFRFEDFPRHQRKFHLMLFEYSFTLNPQDAPPKPREFAIDNPAFGIEQKMAWAPKPIPVSSTDGNVTFILTRVNIHSFTNRPFSFLSAPYCIEPAFSVKEDGQVSSNWQALDMELYDGSGNFSGMGWSEEKPFLCPHEEVWKLRAKFFGSEQSRYASNTTWTLRGIEIPAAGQFASLHSSQTIDGVQMDAMFFAGAGEFHYSSDKEIIDHVSVLKESSDQNDISWPLSDGTLRSKEPHLTFKARPLADNQRLTVRATDEQGRDYYGYEMESRFGTNYTKRAPNEVLYLQKTYGNIRSVTSIFFKLPPDLKKVDLTFCVHTCRVEEFVFKPPANLASAITTTARLKR